MSVVVRNLSKYYGSQKAVDDISFEVKEGDVLGFLGPNGAGKSTTMKMITGYLSFSEGQIQLYDIDIQKNPIASKKLIGYLPENNPLYLDMYVKEYLHFTAGIYQLKAAQKAVDRVIEMTGLTPERNKLIRQLSKGYKQRVGLAQALIHDPKILILDEPTSGLDPNQLTEIRNLIRELGKNKIIILSTHIMQEVQAICNRVMIIQKGKIVANNTSEGLAQQLSGTKSIQVSFENALAQDAFVNLKAISSITSTSTDKNSYLIKGSNALEIKKAVFDTAVRTSNTILQLQDVGTDLEDIFKSLTR